MAKAIWKKPAQHDQQFLHCSDCGHMLQSQMTNGTHYFTCNCGVWSWNKKKKSYELEVV